MFNGKLFAKVCGAFLVSMTALAGLALAKSDMNIERCTDQMMSPIEPEDTMVVDDEKFMSVGIVFPDKDFLYENEWKFGLIGNRVKAGQAIENRIFREFNRAFFHVKKLDPDTNYRDPAFIRNFDALAVFKLKEVKREGNFGKLSKRSVHIEIEYEILTPVSGNSPLTGVAVGESSIEADAGTLLLLAATVGSQVASLRPMPSPSFTPGNLDNALRQSSANFQRINADLARNMSMLAAPMTQASKNVSQRISPVSYRFGAPHMNYLTCGANPVGKIETMNFWEKTIGEASAKLLEAVRQAIPN